MAIGKSQAFVLVAPWAVFGTILQRYASDINAQTAGTLSVSTGTSSVPGTCIRPFRWPTTSSSVPLGSMPGRSRVFIGARLRALVAVAASHPARPLSLETVVKALQAPPAVSSPSTL